jgi:hypothetical protein
MRVALASIAVIASVSFSVPSLAATVESIEGKVWVNRGAGYQRVTAPAEIQAGDLIMAGVGAGAEVVYYDECRVKVRPGGLMTVAREPPCETSAAMHLGAGSLKDSPPIFDAPPAYAVPGRDLDVASGVLVGGVIVGGITAAVLSGDDDDDRRRRRRGVSP